MHPAEYFKLPHVVVVNDLDMSEECSCDSVLIASQG